MSNPAKFFIITFLTFCSCAFKKEKNKGEDIAEIDVEYIAIRQIESFGKYTEIKCPDNAVGHTPDSHNVCFAGNSEAEDFIRDFTEKMSRYLERDVYWRRDFGMWHTEMKFKNTNNSIVMTVMMKGDASNLQENPIMKNYSMFIACAIFDQQPLLSNNYELLSRNPTP